MKRTMGHSEYIYMNVILVECRDAGRREASAIQRRELQRTPKKSKRLRNNFQA